VVGAGAAGLTVSRGLAAAGVEHDVLERAEVADTWLRQRWDSFRLNTPGWMNSALGQVAPTSFSYRDEIVRLLGEQAASLPVRTGTPVVGLAMDGDRFVVRTPAEELRVPAVVVASGMQNVPRVPAVAGRLPPGLLQLHAADYRNAGQLPDGAVLVVGSAQSGCQIAEDLALAGRSVYLSTSRVARFPWWYRGRDLMGWLVDCGFWDQRPQDLPDPAMTRNPQPVVASGGRSLSLPILGGLGVHLLGRLVSVDADTVAFDGSLVDNVRFADEGAARLTDLVDTYIAEQMIDAPEPQPDSGAGPVQASAPLELGMSARDITTVIWCTGFTGDLSWAQLPITDETGTVRHDGCRAPVPGLWLMGFPWLTRRRSGILYGFPFDAAEVVQGVLDHLA
jgi:putative flavoprotein involved in K+ transport